MRPTHRQILASLTFLAPLGLLAWVGGQELGRQAEEIESAQDLQAQSFLRRVTQDLELHIDEFLDNTLDPDTLNLWNSNWVRGVREVSEAVGPQLRDVFLLDDAGNMIFPQPPPTDLGLPLHAAHGELFLGRNRDPRGTAFNVAEVLISQGELEDAARTLETFLEPRRRGGPTLSEQHEAHMMLASILRRQGEREMAAAEYQKVTEDLGLYWLDRNPQDGPYPGAALALTAEVGLAEMKDDADERLRLMEAISDGLYWEVSDLLQGAVMDRLMEGIPADDDDLRQQAREYLRTDRYRIDGRRFAAVYEQLVAETLRRRVGDSTEEPEGRIYEVFPDDEGSWLLALRRGTGEEDLWGISWVGVRVDLALLLNEWMDRYLVPDEAGGFTPAVVDPNNIPIMPAEELPSQGERSTPYGLRVHAVPGDPQAFSAAKRSSVRNRALLIAFLVLVAGGGAFFLWRSVARESELAQLKVDLVSRVSHELKTPLALIRLYGDTLAMGRTRDQGQVTHFAEVITRESERLSNMIGRILDFSRQQAGSLHYEKEPVELGTLITSVTDAYRPHVEAQGASLETDLSGSLVANVDADAMEAAVLNLLENAVKYTPVDAPDRTVRVALHGNNGHAILEIMDRGIGIPAHERERVLESFFRASNAGEARGAGLGLSLVHHFVQAHGGSLEIAGRSGGGTTLRMDLPLVNGDKSHGKPT